MYYVSTNTENSTVSDDGYVRDRYNDEVIFYGSVLERVLENYEPNELGENFSGNGTLYAKKNDVTCRDIDLKSGDVFLTERGAEWLIDEVRDYGEMYICPCRRRKESAHDVLEITDFGDDS